MNPNQYDWCTYEKVKFRHRYPQRNHSMKTKEEELLISQEMSEATEAKRQGLEHILRHSPQKKPTLLTS